ncbi:MAG: response regulator [Gemmatimonadales bacterium]|nr:response regulator [Gemmatimonadales bacterium]NIN11353.1 response regulator [Gemmatimonadales bacterium]NIN49963.1 response regulator [Gemmatimonadales bacterium]NIP07427.1 response regulator [Gemmatimonadales bacterium]NIR00494.1 response regulator [Gemmatimonadales bacterium]
MPTTVLLVEDEDRVRTILRGRLEAAGYEVVEATDGEAALNQYREAPTDVVITDIVMPHKGGQELIGELLQDHPDTRIVAISGALEHDVPRLLEEAQRLGALRTLSKPFTSEQLLDAVSDVLGDRAPAAAGSEVSEAWDRPAEHRPEPATPGASRHVQWQAAVSIVSIVIAVVALLVAILALTK